MIAFIDILAAIACIVTAIVFAKRIGGAAPWLIAAVAAADVAIIVMFRVYFFVMESSRGYGSGIDSTYTLLGMLDALGTYAMGIVMVIACGLLMPRLPRRA